jgi:hypothetical protein
VGGGNSLQREKLDPDVLTKSGIMLGLGETMDEVKAVMRDQRSWGVDILTIGQYLQPSKNTCHGTLLHDGRIRRTARVRQRDRLQVGRVESAGAVFVPCGRAGPRIECGASQVVWRIVNLNGENIVEIDIDQKTEELIGRSIADELLGQDIITDESPTYPKVIGDDLYLKKCATSSDIFMCYLLKVDLSTLTVTEVFRSPGESISSFTVSPDNTIVVCVQCSATNCKLRAYDVKTGELLFEIKDGVEPVWSPDSQYIIFLDRVVKNFYLQSSRLTRISKDGNEKAMLVSEFDFAAFPKWSMFRP